MSYVEDLLAAYRTFVALPWQQNLAPAQRVWMAIYPPEYERRLRLHVPAFEVTTNEVGHGWGLVDLTTSFESWMAEHEYHEEYFQSPDLLDPALPLFFKHLTVEVSKEIAKSTDPNGVVALLGAGSLFGLGDSVKVSALLNVVNRAVEGRLLVFFPGQHEGNGYRLLDARDGWNYLAIPITPKGSEQ